MERIRALAARVASGYGLEVFDVQLRRESIGWVLRVILDRPGPSPAPWPPAPEDAVTIEDCRRVSDDLSAVLDVEDAVDHAYTLEVSSPGLDRPLRHEADYRRFTGRLAKIVVREPVDGQTFVTGRIEGVDAGDVLVRTSRTRTSRVPIAAITRARLEVEF
jgi:ribosome maturation factor RimP